MSHATTNNATTNNTTTNQATDRTTVCPYDNPISVLFIGNSYTAQNKVPIMVQNIASSFNCSLTVSSATAGGASFATHLSRPETLNAFTHKNWEVVVLQNQSQLPGFKPHHVQQKSLPNAKALVQLARKNQPKVKVVFFTTWGRQHGDKRNCAYYPRVCNFTGHAQALIEGYTQYASQTRAIRAPVGDAWRYVVNDPANTALPQSLWSADGSHATRYGSYLAAAVLYASITGHQPEQTSFDAQLGDAAPYLFESAMRFAKATNDTNSLPKVDRPQGNAHIEWSKDPS
jgi:hypothetical protein